MTKTEKNVGCHTLQDCEMPHSERFGMPHSEKLWDATQCKTVGFHTAKNCGMPHSEKTVEGHTVKNCGCHRVKNCGMPQSEKLWNAAQ